MAMFKKSEADRGPDVSSPPKIGEARPIRAKNVSVIGPTLVFKGELSADEDLVIEGNIEGTIAHHKKHLTIGSQGASRQTSTPVLSSSKGSSLATFTVKELFRWPRGADVFGNIYCARIVMEDGARFKGKIDMGEKSKVFVSKEPVQIDPVKAEKISA